MVSLGDRYGRFIVIKERTVGDRMVLCRCECGTEKRVSVGNLVGGKTLSCGCLRRDALAARATHRTNYSDYRYSLWRSIKKRCFTTTHQDYPYYGGRGITMHPGWVADFKAFAAHLDSELGDRPFGQTLDRINNNGNYEPGNLRWASRSDQAFNRRSRWRNREVE